MLHLPSEVAQLACTTLDEADVSTVSADSLVFGHLD